MERGKQQERTMMCLCRMRIDASKIKPGWKAFSDFVVSLIGGAGSQASRLAQVENESQHQEISLCINSGVLTSGSSGSPNTPLRYAFAAH